MVSQWGGGQSPFFNVPIEFNNNSVRLSPVNKFLYDKARLKSIEKCKPELIIIAARWDKSHLKDAPSLLSFINKRKHPELLIESPPLLEIGNRNMVQYLA